MRQSLDVRCATLCIHQSTLSRGSCICCSASVVQGAGGRIMGFARFNALCCCNVLGLLTCAALISCRSETSSRRTYAHICCRVLQSPADTPESQVWQFQHN